MSPLVRPMTSAKRPKAATPKLNILMAGSECAAPWFRPHRLDHPPRRQEDRSRSVPPSFRLLGEWSCAEARGPRTLTAKLGSQRASIIAARGGPNLRGSGRNTMKWSVKSVRSGALAGVIGLAFIATDIGPARALDYPIRP